MNINTNTLIWIVVAWLMIAFFAGIEVAFVRANRLAIELKKKQGLARMAAVVATGRGVA